MRDLAGIGPRLATGHNPLVTLRPRPPYPPLRSPMTYSSGRFTFDLTPAERRGLSHA